LTSNGMQPDRGLAFLAGNSEMAQMMRAHDWSASALGDPHTWSQALRTCVRLMLNTRHPLFLFWGPEAICLYNDGYRAILGSERHAIALGNAGAVVWDEIWDVLSPQIRQVLAGGEATWHENHLIPLTRDGVREDAYWTYSYSPVDDDGAPHGVGGVLVIVTETTETVLAERQAKLEGRRFAQLFEQAPTFMTLLRGPEHVFEYCNPGYKQLIGHRDITGKTVVEALPEIADQGFSQLLDSVYKSGRAYTAHDMKVRLQREPDGTLEDRFLDFVYQPIVEADGKVSGIFVEGVDVTERHYSDIHGNALTRFTDEIRDIDDPEALAFAAARILGEVLDVSRVGFGTIDLTTQTYVAQPAWNAPGLPPPPAAMNLKAFPAYIQKLERGEVIRINDVEADALTKGNLDTLKARYAVAFVNVPVIEKEGLVAILYVSHRFPREWADAEIELIQEIADRTQSYSARLRSASRLAASEAEFRTFAQAMPNHVWASTPKGHLYWFNQRTYEYSGVEAGKLDGTRWREIVHPEDAEAAAKGWERSLATGEAYEAEFRIRRADGIYRWHLVRAIAIRGQDGQVAQWIGTNTDIEDQVVAIEAYTQLNATLEHQVAERTAERDQVWKNSQDLLVVADSGGVFRAISPSITEILGWSVGEVVGKPLIDLVHEDDKAATLAAFEAAVAAELGTFENRYRHKDGSYRWLSWVAAPEEGNVYASGRHITAEREASEALARTQEALRQSQKMESVGQLTGGIAHDFNNMLAVVLGSLELLGRRIGSEDARSHRYVQAATDGAKRAANLTQRLLAFSRQQPLQPEILDPNRLVSGMSDLLRHSIGADIMLQTVLAGGIWRVEVDPNQLENVILNLSVNARDAMPGGGKLTIETQNAHLDARYVSTELGVPTGHYVMIAVTDSGTGMSEEVIARAFDPFFTTKDVGKGTGLGLSQVYGFIKQSGGHVRIYSELDHGTTIKIYLPRAKDDDTVASASEAETLATLMGDVREVILVVDDELAVRQFSADALEELGYRVLEASNAAQALELLAQHPEISLLFTDIIMPETNGRQLVDAAHKIRPDLKVLYTTGYTRNAVVHNGVVDKGVNLIGKPFSIDELAARVREVLDFL
jgi:PAS domain S-box-containing protein